MSIGQQIEENIRQVRNATYGKDVREAIASGLEICYGYTSGETAMEAADAANAAAANANEIVERSTVALEAVESIIDNAESIVKVSETQPTEPENKIWVQPQSGVEYKVASWEAYEELWNQFQDISNTYAQGHGGIVSVIQDTEYEDEEDTLKKRYVITFSDGSTSEFFLNDGRTGSVGPRDTVSDVSIYYHKGEYDENENFIRRPPLSGWVEELPELSSGEYLWTQTMLEYDSGSVAYIYGLSKQGIDGSGAMNSIKLGDNGSPMTGNVVLPLDTDQSVTSGSLVTSGRLQSELNGLKTDIALTGTPTAPTAEPGTNSQQIATTAFVQDAVAGTAIDTSVLFENAALTGIPTAPTAEADSNSTQIATTAFAKVAAANVASEILGGLKINVIQKTVASSSRFILGVPPATMHLVIFSSYLLSDCAMMFIKSNASGSVSVLSVKYGSGVSVDSTYDESAHPCGKRFNLSTAGDVVYVYDIVLWKGDQYESFEQASIKTNIPDAAQYLPT